MEEALWLAEQASKVPAELAEAEESLPTKSASNDFPISSGKVAEYSVISCLLFLVSNFYAGSDNSS